MNHVDIAANSEIVGAPLTVLQVRVPFSATSSAPSSTSNSTTAAQRPKSTSIAKPTLIRNVSFLPVDRWIPDVQVSSCMAPECQLPFTLFNRKHHCRVCGRIYCANCSSHTLQNYGNPLSNGGVLPPASPSSGSPSSSSAGGGAAGRLCSECFYLHQLVVVRRNPYDSSTPSRRKTRGEFKMFQWTLLVHIFSFLPLDELLNVSAVSSDLYFISRDNQLWFVHNMNRWSSEMAQERSGFGLVSSLSSGAAGGNNKKQKPLIPQPGGAGGAMPALSKTTITHHARYNFTQFLDFARRLEGARCQGLSSFSAGARQLLSSPIKICVVGPSGIGKSLLVRRFVGADSVGQGNGVLGTQAAASPLAVHTTAGFATYTKRVLLAGGLTSEAMLSIYDVAGDKRYDPLRVLCAQSCHALVVLYDAHNKMSLVHAANMLNTLEPQLGPQPAVVCGLIADPHKKREVSASGAEGITVRCRVSIQTMNPEEIFEAVVQTLLDRLVLGTAVAPPPSGSGGSSLVSPATAVVSRTVAQELLAISANPSVLDVLLDTK